MTAKKTNELTSGRLSVQILLYSLPLIASNLLQVMFNMADVAVIGQFSGTAALGSVGSTTTLVNIFTGSLLGFGSGISVLAARYLGAHDWKDLHETTHTSLVLSLALGVFALALGQGFSPLFLRLLGTKPELLPGAVLYMRVYLLGMPGAALFNFGNAMFSAAGNTKKPLQYLTAAGILNIVLNLFFVIGLRWGVAGVAAASAISQTASGLLLLRALIVSGEEYGVNPAHIRLTRSKVSPLLWLCLPAALQNAVFYTSSLFVQAGVNSFDATMVAANAAAANADPLAYDVMAAFHTACASFVGQNYGAGNKERIRKSYHISLAYSFGVSACISALLLLFHRQFLGIFTSDPAVVQAGVTRLFVMGLSYPWSAFMDCTIAASRGLGKTMGPTVIVLLGSCVFRIIWVYTIFAYFGTIVSLYLLYIVSWFITAAFEILVYRRYFHEQTSIFKKKPVVA